eukprot:72176-Alexandrium_andersonii.AAC.1
MSASLVGSEMCIRDSTPKPPQHRRGWGPCAALSQPAAWRRRQQCSSMPTVSAHRAQGLHLPGRCISRRGI